MRLKTFHIRDLGDRLGDLVQAFPCVKDEARFFHKTFGRQRREEPGCATGGKYMVRAGNIIADRFRRIVAEEDRACVPNQAQQFKGILDGKFQVLRRDRVGDLGSPLQVLNENDRAEAVDRLARDLFSGEIGELALDLALTLSISSREVVTRMEEASSSCSACESRSEATNSASALLSAMIRISLGPAIMSISTCPKTYRFAVAT